MPRKILVINGHGSKRIQKMQIGTQYSVITPGDEDVNYILSFATSTRHLEGITIHGKIWPITQGAETIEWQHYQQTSIHDISITPLRQAFILQRFAKKVLDKTTGWEKLTDPEHSVLARGALAVRLTSAEVIILEEDDLIKYLENLRDGVPVKGTPIFYCDKELGKIKPLRPTCLSEIYQALELINEFKAEGADIIVATCSPNKAHAVTITVRTDQEPISLDSVTTKKASSSESPAPFILLQSFGGNSCATSIEILEDGGYKIKGCNKTKQPRFIIIDKTGRVTGFEGSNLGVVEMQMKTHKDAIFKHFGIPIPKFDTTEASGSKKEQDPLTLTDFKGDNYVTGIEVLDDGGYKINGHNSTKQPRFIVIDKTGKVTGFNGSILGAVEKQMYAHRAAIFEHFGIPMLEVLADKKATVVVKAQITPQAIMNKFKVEPGSNGNNEESDDTQQPPL
jgi:hypothetical protein